MSYSSNQPPGGNRVLPVPPAPTGPLHSGTTPSPSPSFLPKRLSSGSFSGIQGLNLTAAPASVAPYSSANKPVVPRGSLQSNGPSKAVADMAAQIARNANAPIPSRPSISSTAGMGGSPPSMLRAGAPSPGLNPSPGPLVDRSSNDRSSVIDRALAVNRSSPAIDRSPMYERERAPSVTDRGSLSSNHPPQSTTPSFLHRNSLSGPSASSTSSSASPFVSPTDPNKPGVFRRSVVPPPPLNPNQNGSISAAPTPTHQNSSLLNNGPNSGREPPSALRLSTHRESPPPSPSPVRSPPPFINPRGPPALDVGSPPSTISRPPISSISAAAAAAAHAHYRAGLAQNGNSAAAAPTPVHGNSVSFERDRSNTTAAGESGSSARGYNDRSSLAGGSFNDRSSLAGGAAGYSDRASLPSGGYNDRASLAGGNYNDRASLAGGYNDRASLAGGYNDRASNAGGYGGNFATPTPSAAAGSSGFPFTPHSSSSNAGGFGSGRLMPPDMNSNAGGAPEVRPRPTAPRRSVFRPPTVAMPFSGTLDHKFSVVHDQVDAGLYTLKRLGGMARRLSSIMSEFTKELREEAQHEQSHAQDKILQSDKAMSFTAAYDAVLQSHFVVARQFDAFAQSLDQTVASPVLQAHRELDATRKGIVSEEQRATSELIKLKEQVTRQRIKCYGSWKLLVEADGELQRAFSALYGSTSSGPLSGASERLGVPVIFSQGGAPSPNSSQPLQMDDKTRKNLEKKLFAAEKKRAAAVQQTQKDFSKCEDLVLVTARTQSEYTSTVIPALMQRLEDVERQRLRVARDASERYASSFSAAVNLATPAQQLSVTVGNLDDAGDMARYTAAMLAAHGRPPVAAPVEALLPCPAADLDSDAWRKQLGFDVDSVMPKDPSTTKSGFTDIFFGKSAKDAASLVYSGAVSEIPSGTPASGFSMLGPQASASPSSAVPSVVLSRPLKAPPVYRCVTGFTGGQHHSFYHAAGCPRAPKQGAPPLDLGSSMAMDILCTCNAPAALMEASPAPVSSSSAAAIAAANAGSIVVDLVIPHGAYVFVTDTHPAPASPSSSGEMTAVTSSPFFGAASRDSGSMGSIGSDLSPRSFFTHSGGGGIDGPRRCTIHSQSGSSGGSGGSQSVSGGSSQSRPCASTPSAGAPDDDDGEEDSFNSTTGFLNGSSHGVSTNQRPQQQQQPSQGLLVSVAAGQGAPPALPSRPTSAAVAALREKRNNGGDDPATRARLIMQAATVGARLRDAQASSRSSSNGYGREDSVGSRGSNGCSCSPGGHNHSTSSRSSGEVARYPCGERVWCGELITAPLSPTSIGQQFAQAASSAGAISEVVSIAATSAASRCPYGVGAFPAALLERVVFDDNVPLAYLLHVPEARALFIDHLKREYSVENYDFWSKVQAFRLRPWRAAAASSTPASVQKAMLEGAEDICATYVRNDAPHQVNLKGEIQSEVLSAVAAAKAGKAMLSAAVFVHAEEEIYRLLSQDSLSRFKKTPVFAQLLQAARMSEQQNNN